MKTTTMNWYGGAMIGSVFTGMAVVSSDWKIALFIIVLGLLILWGMADK